MKNLFVFVGTFALIVRDTIAAQLDTNLDMLQEVENDYNYYYL